MRAHLLAVGALVMFVIAAEAAESAKQLRRVTFSDLNGWETDRHVEALATLKLSCQEIVKRGASFRHRSDYGGTRKDWLGACRGALTLGMAVTPEKARAFFEKSFIPVEVRGGDRPQGLFTGYYEPELAGSLKQTAEYMVPVYARPQDLVTFNAAQRTATGLKYGRIVGGKPRPYLTRRAIEAGALSGRRLELVWLKSWPDAFFLHVQGSGRISLRDGSVIRLGFAAKSGHPYTSIGAVLIRQGEVARDDMSMQAIRQWMDAHPKQARALMWHNKSFIFFRRLELNNPDLGPVGAQQVQLTPMRSLAIDRRHYALGTPIWLETTFPGNSKPLNSLMIAQDTGSAITGRVRGDVYFGSGEAAGRLAGQMQQPGRMVALLPLAVVRRLGFGR